MEGPVETDTEMQVGGQQANGGATSLIAKGKNKELGLEGKV